MVSESQAEFQTRKAEMAKPDKEIRRHKVERTQEEQAQMELRFLALETNRRKREASEDKVGP